MWKQWDGNQLLSGHVKQLSRCVIVMDGDRVFG